MNGPEHPFQLMFLSCFSSSRAWIVISRPDEGTGKTVKTGNLAVYDSHDASDRPCRLALSYTTVSPDQFTRHRSDLFASAMAVCVHRRRRQVTCCALDTEAVRKHRTAVDLPFRLRAVPEEVGTSVKEQLHQSTGKGLDSRLDKRT